MRKYTIGKVKIRRHRWNNNEMHIKSN